MKNGKRLLLALAFALPSTFVFKGQDTSYANNLITIHNNSNKNDNLVIKTKMEDGSYIRLPKRTINARGLERQPRGEAYNSKFTEDQMPYEGHLSTMDKDELFAEMQTMFASTKEKFLSTGQTTYYPGGVKAYSKNGIDDNLKTVDSTLSLPLDGFTYPLGLFAAPGETVTLLIPTEYEDILFNDNLGNTLNINIGATLRLTSEVSGIERANTASTYSQYAFPLRLSRFYSNEIFKKENTVVKDGKRYFEGKIASPIGGPIYIQSNLASDQNIEIRSTGALESRLYILNSTTDQENKENYDNFTAPYYDIVTPSLRFSGELRTREDLETQQFKNLAHFYQQRLSITLFFNNKFPRQVYLNDRFFSNGWQANEIYALSNRNYIVFPKYGYSLNYKDYLTASGMGWDDYFNYNAQYHELNGKFVRWGLNPNLNGLNNQYHQAIWGIQSALTTDIAKSRINSSGALDSALGLSDPYSSIRGIWGNRLTPGGNSVDNANIYTSIFHSIGLGTLAEMQKFAWNSAVWSSNKITNANDVLRGLTYYSGFDFTDYVENTIRATTTQEVKDEIGNQICGDTNQSCTFPKFAATGSLYTKSNERVKNLEQWRNDIQANVQKNGIPSYFSEQEASESVKYSANYVQASEYELKNGQSNQDSIDRNVYKRNITGNNFIIEEKDKTTLNLKPSYANSTLQGRIASTADIKAVTLEWQEGEAITNNGDDTYTVDPSKITTANNTYNFALSVQYTDSAIPSEILYGTLEKGQIYPLFAKHYSAENLVENTSDAKSPFDQVGYSSEKLAQQQKQLDIAKPNGTEFNLNSITDKSKGVISVLDFDVHYPAGESAIGISPQGGKAILAQIKEDGSREWLISRGGGGNYGGTNSGDKTYNFDKPTTISYTMMIYIRPGDTTNTSIYLGYKSTGDWGKIPSSMITAVGMESNTTTIQSELKEIPFTGHNYVTPDNSTSDKDMTTNEIGLISYGFFTPGNVIDDDTQDQKAFKVDGFTKYNKYDKSISEDDLKTLQQTEKTISDGLYLTSTSKTTAIKYENMDANYGALYYTYENYKASSINQIILRDEQNFENNYRDYITDTLKGTIGDVSIYVGDQLDENGSPELSKFTKIKTDINNETWSVTDNSVAEYFARSKASNRIIDLDKAVNNKYIVVKIENGQAFDGQKNGSFKVAEIEFHSVKDLGNNYTDSKLTNDSIKAYGTWKETENTYIAKGTQLEGSKGDYLGFRFTGSFLSVSANQFRDSGKLKVTIDGQSHIVDTSSLVMVDDKVVFDVDLDNKEHLVTIEVLEGEVQLTGIRFDSNSFGTVSEKEIKEQVGVKDDTDNPTNPENPSEPNEPTVPENPSSGNNNTNVIILATTFSILGAILIALAVVLIVEHNKRKKNKEVK